MKIKDIITEGLYDYLTQLGQQGKQAAWAKSGASNYYAGIRGQQQAIRQFKPNPARTTPPSQQVAQNQAQQDAVEPDTSTSKLGPNWKDTTLGISIKPATQTSPAMAYYQKKYYVLTNFGKWLTANNRPVPDTTAAILNQALEQT